MNIYIYLVKRVLNYEIYILLILKFHLLIFWDYKSQKIISITFEVQNYKRQKFTKNF